MECAGNGSRRISENARTLLSRALSRVKSPPEVPPRPISSFVTWRLRVLLRLAKHTAQKRYLHRRAPSRHHHKLASQSIIVTHQPYYCPILKIIGRPGDEKYCDAFRY